MTLCCEKKGNKLVVDKNVFDIDAMVQKGYEDVFIGTEAVKQALGSEKFCWVENFHMNDGESTTNMMFGDVFAWVKNGNAIVKVSAKAAVLFGEIAIRGPVKESVVFGGGNTVFLEDLKTEYDHLRDDSVEVVLGL